MKKKLLTTVCATAMSLSLCIPAFAGQWMSNDTGWWWQEDNGSYPVSQWKWLDGNNDGTAECYYFDGNGYMLADTTTSDGYTVNANGAWVENGDIKTQSTSAASAPAEETQTEAAAQTNADAPDITGIYKGTYEGQQIEAIFEDGGDEVWVEIDYFLKDILPAYKGNGLFASDYYSFQFTGNTLVFTDITAGETVSFVKQ